MSEPSSSPNVRRLVWSSMLFATVLYATLGLTVFRAAAPSAVTGLPLLPIFAGASLVLAVAAVMLRGRLFDRVSGMSPSDPLRTPALMQASIVPGALDEMIAVLGYVLAMVGRPPLQWLPFCAAGFALLMLHAPRSDA